MTRHDYLVLGIAAFWMVTGVLGLGFTLRRLRSPLPQKRRQQQDSKATAAYG
jgi:hypothetical protein